jgi:hypothetical protein
MRVGKWTELPYCLDQEASRVRHLNPGDAAIATCFAEPAQLDLATAALHLATPKVNTNESPGSASAEPRS